jgi:hypothetical protein
MPIIPLIQFGFHTVQLASERFLSWWFFLELHRNITQSNTDMMMQSRKNKIMWNQKWALERTGSHFTALNRTETDYFSWAEKLSVAIITNVAIFVMAQYLHFFTVKLCEFPEEKSFKFFFASVLFSYRRAGNIVYMCNNSSKTRDIFVFLEKFWTPWMNFSHINHKYINSESRLKIEPKISS